MPRPPTRTTVYVDGINLYYGALRGTPHRWLDLQQFCQRALQPHHAIDRIRYFTARVSSSPKDPSQATRQQIYLRALETLPNLSIHYGHFLRHKVRMPLAAPTPGGPTFAQVIKTEEKGSDVNLASYLLRDGFKQEFDAAIVISNDSDLTTPIQIVRRELHLDVGMICPYRRPSVELRKASRFCLRTDPAILAQSQFPPTLKDAAGRTIRKPSAW